jgi:hypothetical protein
MQIGDPNLGNDAVGGLNVRIWIERPADATRQPQIFWQGTQYAADNNVVALRGGGRRIAAQATQAIRLKPASGVCSLKYSVYGLK